MRELYYRDEPEVDRVKRYFVGKELQKVWGEVREVGRQRIIKQYSTIGIIITEEEVEEPLPGEDDSLPNPPMSPDTCTDSPVFDFGVSQPSTVKPDVCILPSKEADLTDLLVDPIQMPDLGGPCFIDLRIDRDALWLSKGVEPDWDFYEYCYDDTWTKVNCSHSGRSHDSAILQD